MNSSRKSIPLIIIGFPSDFILHLSITHPNVVPSYHMYAKFWGLWALTTKEGKVTMFTKVNGEGVHLGSQLSILIIMEFFCMKVGAAELLVHGRGALGDPS